MKKQLFKFCLGLGFIGAFFWACNKDDDSTRDAREPFFEISTLFFSENEVLGIQEDSLKVAIKTNSYWEVKKGEDAFWLSVTPNKGTGDQTVNIKSKKHLGVGERSTWLFFEAYSIIDSVKVTQEGRALLLSKTKFEEVPSEGTSLTFTVESDRDWVAELSETTSWLSLNTTEGSKGKSELEVVVATNEQPLIRKDSILFATTGTESSSKIWLSISQLEGESTLSVSTEAANLLVEGGTFKVNIESNVPWNASSNIEGLSFNPASGEGTMETTVTYPETNLRDARTIELKFAGKEPNDTLVRTLEVLQLGTSSLTDLISVTPSNFKEVSAEGSSLKLSLSANKPWKTTKTATWLTVAPANGEVGNAEIQLTVAENLDTTVRTDSILFVSEDNLPNSEVWVKVSQKGFVPKINVTSEINEVAPGEGSFQIELNSNVPWGASSSLDGVLIEPESGLATDDTQFISVTYPENSSEEVREFDLVFTGKEPYDSFESTITIQQQGATASAIVVGEEYVTINGENQIFEIEVSSSTVNWSAVSNNPQFIITENSSGLATENPVVIKVNAQANTTLSSLSGIIEIQDSDDPSFKTSVFVEQGLHPQNDEGLVYADPSKSASEIGLDRGVSHPKLEGWDFWNAHEFATNDLGFWGFNTKVGIKNAVFNPDMKEFKNGTLKIKTRKLASPTVNQHGDPAEYETAPIYSKRHHQGGPKFVKFTTNMRVEVRFKTSGHTGFNTAIWFMGQSNYDGQGIKWPDAGEIDLVEAPFPNQVHFSLHTENFSTQTRNAETAHVVIPDETEWNIYWVEILEDRIIGGINGYQYFEHVKGDGGNHDWPWDNPAGMQLIVSPGIGAWTGIMPNMTAGEEAFMELDWIRVYTNEKFNPESQAGHDHKFY